MDIDKSIQGTVFERVKREYYGNLPDKEADALIMKVLYTLLSR